MQNYNYETGEKLSPKIRNWRNYDHVHETKGEVNNLPSMTVPDQAIGLRELVLRYTRGQEIPQFNTEFAGDFPDLSKVDKLDLMDMAMQNKELILQTREELSQRAEEKKKARLAAEKETLDLQLKELETLRASQKQ